MASHSSDNYIDKRAKMKREWAELGLKIMFESDKEREDKAEILDEILRQIDACEGMLCPASAEQIFKWLHTENVYDVYREAHKMKFAS